MQVVATPVWVLLMDVHPQRQGLAGDSQLRGDTTTLACSVHSMVAASEEVAQILETERTGDGPTPSMEEVAEARSEDMGE